VPPADRWQEARRAEALRVEAVRLVERLLEELKDPLDVADRLRADEALSEDLRRAALRCLLMQSPAGKRAR